jgi:hypothetical protein
MPTIDPNLVPTVTPGNLFDRFTNSTSLNIRWFVAQDPVYFEVLNRPIADLAVRQLILAKTVDALNLRLGHQALFPFLVQPRMDGGSGDVDIPSGWIWDMQVSLPRKWENVRLAKVKRMSGTNTTSYTGVLRLVFTATAEGSSTEVALFQADYTIDSTLAYQIVRVSIPTSADESVVVPQGESETIDGFITFRTLDLTDSTVTSFLDVVEPPTDTTTGPGGLFITPNVIQVLDSVAGGSGVTDDFNLVSVSHGTGLLTLSATNPIPPIDATVESWLNTFNYPFDVNATLQSSTVTSVTIPTGLFREFNMVVPASDVPTGDSSGNYFPVYLSRIERSDTTSDTLVFYFATYNVETPSIVPIEFATLTLERTFTAGQVVSIVPSDDLWVNEDGDEWLQGFGEGHVVLSDLWGSTSSTVSDFFDAFVPLIGSPAEAVFTQETTRVSSFGLTRLPKYTPTAGQAAALRGTRAGTSDPSATNRYVVEGDQGTGDQVDFATHASLAADKREHPDIERFGYTGSLAHRIVRLSVNAGGNLVYTTDILPRLRILLGRDPQFGDFWYDGTRLKFFNGSTWQG